MGINSLSSRSESYNYNNSKKRLTNNYNNPFPCDRTKTPAMGYTGHRRCCRPNAKIYTHCIQYTHYIILNSRRRVKLKRDNTDFFSPSAV